MRTKGLANIQVNQPVFLFEDDNWFSGVISLVFSDSFVVKLNNGKVRKIPKSSKIQMLLTDVFNPSTKPLSKEVVADWVSTHKSLDPFVYKVGDRVIVTYDLTNSDSNYLGTITGLVTGSDFKHRYKIKFDDGHTVSVLTTTKRILGKISSQVESVNPISRQEAYHILIGKKPVSREREWKIGYRIVVSYGEEGNYIGTVIKTNTLLTILFDNGQVDRLSPHDKSILGYGTSKLGDYPDGIPTDELPEYLLPPNKPPVRYQPVKSVDRPNEYKTFLDKDRIKRRIIEDKLSVSMSPDLLAAGQGKLIEVNDTKYVVGKADRLNRQGIFAYLYLIRLDDVGKIVKPSVFKLLVRRYQDLPSLIIGTAEEQTFDKAMRIITNTGKSEVINLVKGETNYDDAIL